MGNSRLATVIVVSGIFIALAAVIGCEKKETSGKPDLPEGFSEVTGGDIAFQWKISGNTLAGILSAPTEGWVSVGFNPTEMMKDANLIIGFVKDGKAEIRDDYGSGLTSHTADTSNGGTADVTLLSGEEKNGWTIIRFSMPLDSGDSLDGSIKLGETTVVLFAYGGSDNFSGMHRQKTKKELVFQ